MLPTLIEKSKYVLSLQPYQVEQLKLISRWIELTSPKHVFDAGCGSGVLTEPFLDKCQWTGLDFSPIVDTYHSPVVRGDLSDIPFADKAFDLSICIDVLEHVDDAKSLGILSELARVSKQYVIVIVPREPRLEVVSISCPYCNNLFHPSGHVRRVFDNHVIPSMEQSGFSLAEKSEVGTVFAESPEIDRVYLVKRMWEQLLYYPYACDHCGNIPKEFYWRLNKEEFLTEVYHSIKNSWFSTIENADLRMSEIAYLFSKKKQVKEKKYKIKKLKPSNKISREHINSIINSPYVLPISSYIVIDGLSNLNTEDSGFFLKTGSYRLFFIKKPYRIVVALDSQYGKETLSLIYWLDSQKKVEIDPIVTEEGMHHFDVLGNARLMLEGYHYELVVSSDKEEGCKVSYIEGISSSN